MADESTKELQEIKDPEFDLKSYINEKSVEKRIQLAQHYYKNASATWVSAYNLYSETLAPANTVQNAQVDNLLDNFSKQVVHKSENNTENSEIRRTVPRHIQALEEYTSWLDFKNYLTSKSDPRAEQIDTDSLWMEFIQFLDLPDEVNPVIQEVINFIKQKAEEGKFEVINSSSAPNEESRTLRQRFARSIGSSYTRMYSKLDAHFDGKIFVIADLIDQDASPYDMLISLAHEKGHDLLGEDFKDSIIFQEFFAMLEERRLYFSLTEAQKNNVAPLSKQYLDPESKTYKGTLPGLKNVIFFPQTTESIALRIAYMHGLLSYAQNESVKYITETLKGIEDDKLKNISMELAQGNILRSRRVGAPIKWEKVRD